MQAALFLLLLVPLALAVPYCAPKPEGATAIYVYTGDAIMELKENIRGTNIYCADLNMREANVLLGVSYPGTPEIPKYPLMLEDLSLPGFSVTRTIVFYPDRTVVTYAASGKGTVMVEDELPKALVPDVSLVQGSVVFTNVDPIIRVFLRSDGETAAVSYTILRQNVLPTTKTVELSSCNLEIPDVLHTISGDQVIIRFSVLQDGRPVYIPLKVLVDGRVITPQFDQSTRTYTLLFPATQGTHNVLIRARIEGCPALERAYSFSVGLSLLPLYLALLAFVLILLLRFARKRAL